MSASGARLLLKEILNTHTNYCHSDSVSSISFVACKYSILAYNYPYGIVMEYGIVWYGMIMVLYGYSIWITPSTSSTYINIVLFLLGET